MIEEGRYLILVEGGPSSSYSAWSPDVPGCVATGSSIEECIARMRAALRGHIEVMVEHGEAVPQASGPGEYVERALAA